MRNLKCSLTGCSNRAYSWIKVENNSFEFDIIACHKHHDRVTDKNDTVKVKVVRVLPPWEKNYQ